VDSFDSETVGLSMVKIIGLPASDNLAGLLTQWVKERSEEGHKHASVRVNREEAGRIAALEKAGFRRVETLITLVYTGSAPDSSDPRISDCVPGDRASILALSQGVFDETRYALDPWMPEGTADRVVAAWVENNLKGRADRTWVAKVDGETAGFLSSLWRPDEGLAVIDLIAVGERFERQGLGRALALAMVSHYFNKATRISVGTQATNSSALALYQRTGFREDRFELGFASLLGG
jgi:GNAT superfamily N-acetyltransferase